MYNPYAALHLFKTVKVRAVLILPYMTISRILVHLTPILPPVAINRILSALVPDSFFNTVDPFWVRNPSTFDPSIPPLVLPIDIEAFQIDATINAVPLATVRVNVGFVFSQHYPTTAVGIVESKLSLAHSLEKFFSDPAVSTSFDLRASIYAHYPTIVRTPEYAPFPDLTFDMEDGTYPFLGGPMPRFSAEWVCLFDGFITGASDVLSTGESESVSISLTLTHFLDQLNYSSSLTSLTGPVNKASMAYNVYQLTDPLAGLLGQGVPAGWTSSTGAGLGALHFGAGGGGEIDFWGYHMAQPVENPDGGIAINRAYGLKSFLKALCNYNIFNWLSLFAVSPDSAWCAFNPLGAINWRAADALNRIEPITALLGVLPSGFFHEEANIIPRIILELAIRLYKLATPIWAAGMTRSELVTAIGEAYYLIGYRYGMPIPLSLIFDIQKSLTENSGFGYDIAFATYGQLAERTYWELIVNNYFPRYSLFLMPRASYALVAPLLPTLNYAWQYVQSRDCFSIVRESKRRTPLRGVILLSPLQNEAGLFAAGQPRAGMENLAGVISGVFDSCNPGVFEVKAAPNWIQFMNFIWAFMADKAFDADQRMAFPWENPKRDALGNAANFGMDVNNLANLFPLWWLRTLNLLARSYFAVEYTKGNSMIVTSKFRYDIAPGSVILVELPKDKTVEIQTFPSLNVYAIGMVTKMTIEADAVRQRAFTHFHVSFVRTGRQLLDTGINMNRHPFWGTVVAGAPWADSRWIQSYLGFRGSLITFLTRGGLLGSV